MKKIFLFILSLIFVACSSKPVHVTDQPSESERILQRVMSAVFDSTITVMDVKDDLYRLIDTMQYHAQFHPNVDMRIGAKSLAMDLAQMFLAEGYVNPDELQFIEDSVLLKLTAINQLWYIDIPTAESDDYPVMNQTIMRRRDDDEKSYITELDIHLQPDSNFIVVFFPEDAVANPTIMFGKDGNIGELDDVSFHASDALKVYERTDSTNMALIFDESLIDAMMSHEAMFIGYINDDFNSSVDNRFKDCMTLLWKFHEQYPEFLKLR